MNLRSSSKNQHTEFKSHLQTVDDGNGSEGDNHDGDEDDDE